MKKLLFIIVLLVICSTLSAAPEHRTSLDQAVSEARDRYNGRVLSAETKRRGKSSTHNIRILTKDGRVRRYNVDEKSGRQIHPRRK